jgi:hypothetical protein
MDVMERTIGFIICTAEHAYRWRLRLYEQFEHFISVGRTNIVVMLDTFPVIDREAVTSFLELESHARDTRASCTFVALQAETIAALQSVAPGALRVIQRIEDIPARGAAA